MDMDGIKIHLNDGRVLKFPEAEEIRSDPDGSKINFLKRAASGEWDEEKRHARDGCNRHFELR